MLTVIIGVNWMEIRGNYTSSRVGVGEVLVSTFGKIFFGGEGIMVGL